MSGTNPVFLVRKAKKSSGQKDAVLWCSDDFEAANATLDYLLIKSGAKLKDYFKAVATNFPVVNELPPEGELSLTFCDYYQLAKDNMTWTQIPGVTLPSSEAAAAARQHIVDGVDTETGEVLEDHTENFGNESNSPAQATAPAPELTVVATMPLRHRVLAQYIGEGEYLYHVDASQKKEILRLEMDTDNSYVQNLLLAAENVEAFKKAIEHDIHKIVNAVKKVFPVDGKTPELATVIQFLKTWFETEHIDRGLLVKEWAKGNRVSAIQRTESGANAGGGNKTDRNPDYEHTLDTLDVEIAMATLPMDFNIYELPGSVYRRAKEIVKKKESPFKEWSAALRATPGILDYSRAAIFALIRSAHPEFYHYPGRLQGYINANLTETDHENPTEEALTAARHTPEKDAVEEANRQLAAARGEYVEGISDPNDPKWVKTGTSQPTTEPELVKNVGNGIFDVSALMQNSSTQSEPEAQQNVPESQQEEPEAAWPEYFEPGRYEGVPNEVYHAANGISSTQVKDARVSLMYFNARHVEKTIVKERSPVLDMGNLVHALALQPENLEAEFSVEPEIPEGAFTTTATLREFIDAHNASLPALLSADDIKALLEEYNATLPSQMPLGASVDETYASYEQLPEEFQRIENGTKHTATAMKACIKEYNVTLPAPVKTSGSRDALLEQLAIINPDLVAQEAQKSSPLKVSGTKADLIQAVKSVNPAVVFADELLDAWRENTEGKVLVTRQQLSTALNIQKALLEHPTAGKLLTHPSRAVEVSYFGIDEETGLEVRVRPDLELDMGGLRIGADLKTISMWNIKQEGLRAKLHREIIDRDYHLSAAMYCETAALDQFFWIFVNKDENYHWVAIIEASTELLELGMLEYRKTMRAIANGFDTGEWPAPITEDYTDELNDFDVRRLEALRVQA
ncbi:exodeoxyribonuclease [Salmonella enterica subsp. enterica serovar Typhimurium]|uniref:RecE family exodeoxyribonuclease n=1 Tax=Salmonella enterica TaxID=28901 RepID=UPI00096F71A7|nr:RecE family exodeoxyribonuclease [Salmonella enterica]OMA57560.1 exodeoxyribonuclease [Salmonella enterica subsp. enterica serovar Typhimurium]